MDNYEKAAKRIGNTFDLVLIACERMRELEAERSKDMETSRPSISDFKKQRPLHHTAMEDISSGKVGREYLGAINARGNGHKRKKFG